MNCFVVGISAPSGGGKTALVQHLAQAVTQAVALSFDEYDEVTEGANLHPENLQQWLRDGADYNAWQMPGLIRDLAKLKQGQPIRSPIAGAWLTPQPLIFLDAPFGYANAQLRPYLDYVVYVDTPLDIAMARRIERDYSQQAQPNAEVARQQIQKMVSTYLVWARQAYLAQDRQVKPHCDLVLDGMLAINVLVEQILVSVEARIKGRRTSANELAPKTPSSSSDEG